MTATPGIVTAITEHPRRRGRFVVLIDGVERGLVGVDTIADLGIAVGRALDAAALSALDVAARRTALFDKALDLLAVRARSTSDLRGRLRRHSDVAGDIGWVLDRLTSLGYLDDEAFARQLARARVLGGGVSKRRLQDELYRRGVPREVGAAAVDGVLAETELDEFGAALQAAKKRLRSMSKLDPGTRRRRLYAWLARRGYDGEVVAAVLRQVLAPGAAEGDGDAGQPDFEP
jgi:regulatory protein